MGEPSRRHVVYTVAPPSLRMQQAVRQELLRDRGGRVVIPEPAAQRSPMSFFETLFEVYSR